MGLGVANESMIKSLCYRQVVVNGEVIFKPMTLSEASSARDALAKQIYSLLFQKIVSSINKSMASSSENHRYIGILDIYGFEKFETSSFEQFFINYANEMLQQLLTNVSSKSGKRNTHNRRTLDNWTSCWRRKRESESISNGRRRGIHLSRYWRRMGRISRGQNKKKDGHKKTRKPDKAKGSSPRKSRLKNTLQIVLSLWKN